MTLTTCIVNECFALDVEKMKKCLLFFGPEKWRAARQRRQNLDFFKTKQKHPFKYSRESHRHVQV